MTSKFSGWFMGSWLRAVRETTAYSMDLSNPRPVPVTIGVRDRVANFVTRFNFRRPDPSSKPVSENPITLITHGVRDPRLPD